MRRVKTRTFSGVVCEQEVFTISELARNVKKTSYQLRFNSEEEKKAYNLARSKRKHARLVNTNFHAGDLYSTLTMDNEHEVHTFKEAKRLRDNFVRRLCRAYPNAKIIIYLGRGKNTSRIHAHMLSSGIPAEFIEQKWGLGEVVRIEPLKEHNYYDGEDYGQDYTGLANYLFDHWTEEQGGHRWKQTQNLKKPEKEDPKEIKREYSVNKPPKAPKGYILVESKETTYGYLYFKYIKIPEKKSRKKSSQMRI